ncbi:uncharacterized protein LOC135389530 [Ornithodoros turicata]|uniref:uncharacterized protein LOC135389530 n=1 Tax=Ornithodoros turicata TaxID=34597 RepID=UPI003139B463
MTSPGEEFIPGGCTSLVNGWYSDLQQFRLPSNEDVVEHLNSSGVPSARQMEEGHCFKEEGYVRQIYVHTVSQDCDYNVVKCICLPSMRSGYYVVHAVIRKDNGSIAGAHCYCAAGLSGSCQHVAGLLFSHAEWNHRAEPSCTDMPCKWVVPPSAKQPDPPATIDKIDFRKNAAGVTRSRYIPSAHLTPASSSQLAAAVEKAHPECLWLRYNRDLDDDTSSSHLQPPTAVPTSDNFMCADWKSYIQQYFEAIQPLTEEERVHVQQATTGQASNRVWHEERTGRLTSSLFGRIRGCRKPEGLLKEILYSKKQVRCEAMQYGQNHEGVAFTHSLLHHQIEL